MLSYERLSNNVTLKGTTMTATTNVFASGLDISAGRVKGVVAGTTTGILSNLSIGAAQTVWEQGGVYVLPSTPETFYIVSTSASDVANTFLVTVLDEFFVERNVIVTLNGTTPVALSGGVCFRFNGCINVSNTESLGTVYIYAGNGGATSGVPNVTSKIQTKIPAGYEASRDAFYTVPFGKILSATHVRAYVGKNKDADITIIVHPVGSVPFLLISYQLYQTVLNDDFLAARAFPAGTTFEFRASSENNNTKVVVSASYVLIDDK